MTSIPHSYDCTDLSTPDTNNATKIAWFELPKESCWRGDYLIGRKERYYQHLDRLNRGIRYGYWHHDGFETFLANNHMIDCLAGPLELSDKQHNRAKKLIQYIDLEKKGIRVERMGFAICTYVLHTDDEDERDGHPQSNIHDNVENLQEQLDIRDSDFISDYHKIQHEVNPHDTLTREYDRREMNPKVEPERMQHSFRRK